MSDRLIGVGYSRAAVVETMMSMALSDLDELYGLQEATHYILKARSLRRKGAEAEGRDEARPIPPAAVTG